MKASSKQRAWVYWLLNDTLAIKWVNRFYLGDTNIKRLETLFHFGTYDETTREMVNVLLWEFNEDKVLKEIYFDYQRRRNDASQGR